MVRWNNILHKTKTYYLTMNEDAIPTNTNLHMYKERESSTILGIDFTRTSSHPKPYLTSLLTKQQERISTMINSDMGVARSLRLDVLVHLYIANVKSLLSHPLPFLTIKSYQIQTLQQHRTTLHAQH